MFLDRKPSVLKLSFKVDAGLHYKIFWIILLWYNLLRLGKQTFANEFEIPIQKQQWWVGQLLWLETTFLVLKGRKKVSSWIETQIKRRYPDKISVTVPIHLQGYLTEKNLLKIGWFCGARRKTYEELELKQIGLNWWVFVFVIDCWLTKLILHFQERFY